MKKKLLLAMFTIATVFSLVACGGDKETASKKEDTKKEESKKDDKDDDKKKPSDEDKDISDLLGALTGKDNENDNDDITPEPTETPVAPTEAPEPTTAPSIGTDSETAVNYEEMVDADFIIANTNEVTMAILDFSFNEDSDYLVTLYLENKTDEFVTFEWDDCSINDVVCDPNFSYNLAPGMNKLRDVSFDAEDLAIANITNVTKLEFSCIICNENTWYDRFVDDSFVVYPKGADAATPHVREPKDTDIVLVDTDALSIIVVDSFTDDDSNYNMVLYYENKLSDKELSFSVASTTINDWGFDVFNYDSIPAGKKCFSTFKWYASDLEVRDITDITSILLPIKVVCEDTSPTTEYVNETFTVNP